MGSFYTSCGLSNHQIFDNEKIVGYFLKPSDKYRAHAYTTYAWDLFSFASLPLVGEYADYGTIELTTTQSQLSKQLLNPEKTLAEFQQEKWRGNEGGFIYFHQEVYEKALKTFGSQAFNLSEVNDFINKNRDEYDQSKTNFLADMNLGHALMDDENMRGLGYFFENIGGYDGIHSSIKRVVKQHIISHLNSEKHPEIKEFKDIPYVEEMLKALYEMRDLSFAMGALNKIIMPQFTSGQDNFTLEEAKWNTFMLGFSNQRVKSEYDNDCISDDDFEAFKAYQQSSLEAQILDFGVAMPLEHEQKKVNKM